MQDLIPSRAVWQTNLESDNQIFFERRQKGGISRAKAIEDKAANAQGTLIKGSRIISATEAARSFSELLDRVCYRGETFVIERGGELVCEMSHVTPPRFTGADFLTLIHSLPKPDPGYWDAGEVNETIAYGP